MDSAFKASDGNFPVMPDAASFPPDIDLRELTACLTEAQRASVFRALQEGKTSGKGLDPATSIELNRLMSMIVASRQLGRASAAQNRAVDPHPPLLQEFGAKPLHETAIPAA